jgi:uncharacterized OsmC-like protein
VSDKVIVTKLNLIDGYKFNVQTDVEYIPEFVVDETKPDGEGVGPNPPRLLATAVGHCMSSSLIFCLKKARIPIEKMETAVKMSLFRNEKGYLRIRSIDVEIGLKVDKEYDKLIQRCLTLFEEYCTVTQSIRKGIEVNVNVK